MRGSSEMRKLAFTRLSTETRSPSHSSSPIHYKIKMVKIHGLIYIAVGLFVSIFSWKLNYEKLIFFFYAGLFFIFVGIIKLIFNFIKKRMNKKETVHHKISQHQPQQSNIKYCHNCGTALRLHHRFCIKCGARV